MSPPTCPVCMAEEVKHRGDWCRSCRRSEYAKLQRRKKRILRMHDRARSDRARLHLDGEKPPPSPDSGGRIFFLFVLLWALLVIGFIVFHVQTVHH
jgi:hypothetical protein